MWVTMFIEKNGSSYQLLLECTGLMDKCFYFLNLLYSIIIL
jgi:hypothetical protein